MTDVYQLVGYQRFRLRKEIVRVPSCAFIVRREEKKGREEKKRREEEKGTSQQRGFGGPLEADWMAAAMPLFIYTSLHFHTN